MKHHQHYFIHQVHRLLMIVAALTLWQGVSWGVIAKTQKSIENVIIDGFNYTIQDGTAYVRVIPDIEIVKVPAEITYDNQKYPVKFGYSSNTYNNVKEIYCTYSIPEQSNYVYLPEGCVVHVPESLYDKAKSAFYGTRITDGKRWYLNSYNYYTIEQDGNTYRLFYPEDGEPYATLSDCPDGETLRVPLTVTETISSVSKLTYPVTGTSVNNSNIKDVYISRANVSLSYYFNSEATIHVPEANFYEYLDAAYANRSTARYWITDEVRKAHYSLDEIGDESIKSLYANFDGYIVVLDNTNNENKAYIYDFPDRECIKFPAEYVFDKETYPVKSINSHSKHSSIKEIYFSNICTDLFSGELARQITIHVPDSLFEKALTLNSNYLYGKVTDGKRWAYLNSIYPDNPPRLSDETYYPESYYDVNGDGKMEVFGQDTTCGYYNNSLFVSSLEGSVVRKEGKLWNGSSLGSLNEPFYGIQMGMYDKEGLPLITSNRINEHPTTVYSYAKNQFIFKSDKNIPYITIADINGDGLKEILPSAQYYNNSQYKGAMFTQKDGTIDIVRMTADGSFVSDKLYVTSDTTEIHSSMLDDYTPNSGKIEISSGGNSLTIKSLADGMFVKAKPAPDWNDWKEFNNISETSQAKQMVAANGVATYSMDAPTGYCTARDLNGDGLIDLQDGSNIYYNLGNNKFFKSPHKGTIYSADLTGNGLLDFIDFGDKQVDLYINMDENGEMQMKTLLKNTAISNTFFGDFDKDGDVDILFVIPGSDYTVFQFYRNEGNGVFKAKDTDRDGTYTCIACNDYDGDGLYEILAQPKNSASDYVLLKINQKLTVSETALPSYVRTIGDVNNDGKMELVYSGNTSYVIYDDVPNSKTNSRPEKMEKPSAVAFADAGKLKISWKRGKDAETSACDLTYELRIGSESGKGDVYFGRANADGTRRVIEDGNMGRSLKYMFDTNNLTEGKYYIAVQAVDASGLGGPWSDELVYDHKISAPSINKLADGYCTADTVTITIQNPVSTATYEWSLSNGSIVSQNENGSIIQAVFERSGEQTVTASMTQNGQTYKSDAAKITLVPSKYASLPASSNRTISVRSYDHCYLSYLDLNQNGDIAVLGTAKSSSGSSTESEYGFFENKEGIYNKVRKTWNSDLTNGTFFIADFNHDGYPDFYLKGQDKGNVFTNSGDEDGSYEYETETFKFQDSSYKDRYYGYPTGKNLLNIDLNNDGKLNLLSTDVQYLYTNSEDERTFNNDKTNNLFDLNRDGSLDRWYNKTDYTLGKAQTKVELRVAGEYDIYKDAKVFYENSNSYDMKGFADFNNDGYVDGYFLDKAKDGNYYNLVIVKGKPIEEWPCKQTVVIPIPGVKNDAKISLIDFDNNGYLDFYFQNGSSSSGYEANFILLDKDFRYIAVSGKELGIYSDYLDEYHWQPLTPGAYPNGYKSNIKNEAPSAPTNVTATSVYNGLLLKWDDATDDHTPWMQMRYNVSLKVKGKTGENAFVLSPLNGLSDDAAICSGVYYRKANQLVVPKNALVNGTTYELQVQAIDLMGEHSPMTKPVEVTYYAEKFILSDNEEFFQNTNCAFGLANASTTDYTVDPGEGGKIKRRAANGGFVASWSTTGEKTITVKEGNETFTRKIIVKPMLELTIDLPERIMLNTPLTVKVPESFASKKYEDFGFKESEAYKVEYEKGDSIATITFKEAGTQQLAYFLHVDNMNWFERNVTANVINEIMPTAEIKSVESDGKYYRVNWNTELPSEVTQVEISRETKRVNQFEVLDIVSAADGTFVDLTSDNRVQPQRYRIRLVADNGMQFSDYSTPHNPLHVMINKIADQRGNNLMWNAYEGLEVNSYTIMRGTSANKLKAIATIAGSQQNYTDYEAPAGVSYYAVKFEASIVAGAKAMNGSRSVAAEDVSSNVISSEEAMATTEATSIYAGTVESNAKLTTDQQELHMVAMILPTYATFNKVNWSIVSGGEYATISQSGLLTAKGGKGDVVVRVVTLDGSNLSNEITIPCDVNVLAQDIDVRAAKKSVEVGSYLLLNAVLTPKNTTMSDVTWKSEDTAIATVDESGILKALSTGIVKVTATTKDGSNLSAYINIHVVEPTGISGVTLDGNDADLIYFDLEGRKVKTPQKGHVYITNKGEKIAF